MGDLFTDFTLRTIALGAIVLGVTSGVLGVFALLRRQSLLGDVLSHAALPGVCIGFLISGATKPLPILIGALISAIIAALFMLMLCRMSRIKEDAALGAVLSFFFAIGTVLLTYIQQQNNSGQSGLDSFLFGQAAAILPDDVVVMAVVGVAVVGFVMLLWKEVKVVLPQWPSCFVSVARTSPIADRHCVRPKCLAKPASTWVAGILIAGFSTNSVQRACRKKGMV